MADTNLSIARETVQNLLKKGGETPFVIPEYQRPYAWSEDQIRTLFDDLIDYTKKRTTNATNDPYFLGCIVSFKNDANELEIIDGQQRITSLMLLLRAIYKKLEDMEPKTKEAENFIRQIGPTIWKVNDMTGEIDPSQILLTSKVINNDGNLILKTILETGCANAKAKDNYSKNYIIIQSLLDELSQKDPLNFYYFVLSLLNYSILLPIQAESQDTALTIFSTLNNRGLPLSDADIFKAKIYNHLSLEEKNGFIEEWQELEERANNIGESIQQLFYYYMFYLRALDRDDKTTTPGVRNYFLKTNLKNLLSNDLLKYLNKILDLMVIVNRGKVENNKINKESLKILDILSCYPNEFWKYPVINYYLFNYENENFAELFEKFLKELTVCLASKYLETPTINAVKSDILKLNVSCVSSTTPVFTFKLMDSESLKEKIKIANKNIVRMLLEIFAYTYQDDLLPIKWEIEHILPQKYQPTYFSSESDEKIKEMIEHIGNKVPFEKKLNIQASNNFFEKKKEQYKDSSIKVVLKLSKLPITDWKLDKIYDRDVEVSNKISETFDSWNSQYNDDVTTKQTHPTKEEQKLIDEFKKKGFI